MIVLRVLSCLRLYYSCEFMAFSLCRFVHWRDPGQRNNKRPNGRKWLCQATTTATLLQTEKRKAKLHTTEQTKTERCCSANIMESLYCLWPRCSCVHDDESYTIRCEPREPSVRKRLCRGAAGTPYVSSPMPSPRSFQSKMIIYINVLRSVKRIIF